MPANDRGRWTRRLASLADPDARRLVQMLRDDARAGGPLDRPLAGATIVTGHDPADASPGSGGSGGSNGGAVDPGAAAALADIPELPPGFTLRRLLGVGGSSVVVEAEQQRPHRRVAFKMLARDITGPRLRARFEAEAEILAGLDHPGIASVLATGILTDGRPWLATELVDGAQPIDAWARPAAPVQWLLALADVCDAVHHGHGRGVVHRDLKPANILVDAADRPRVIDFGVARLADRGRPAVTRAGEYVGTPRYMSPEQLDADPQAVDVRTDIHALGLVLLQLATGTVPPPLADRIARPPGPADLPRVPPRYRRDLALMIRTAIAPNPDERYPAASDLARDVRSLVARRPIAARHASLGYVVLRALQRHPVATAVAGVGLASILAAGGVAAESVRRIAASERAAQQENTRMRSAVTFFDAAFASLDPQQDGASLPVADFLERAGDRIPPADELDGPMRAELHGLIAGAFERIGVYDRGLQHLEDAIDAAAEPDPITGTVNRGTLARLRLDRVGVLFDLDRLDESHAALEGLLAELRSPGAPWPDLRWEAENEVGVLLLAEGRPTEAAAHLESLRSRPLPRDVAFDVAVNLSHAWSGTGRADDAVSMLQDLVAAARGESPDPEAIDRLEGGSRALGEALAAAGRTTEALAAMDDVARITAERYGPDHVTHALAVHRRANLQLSTILQLVDPETERFAAPDDPAFPDASTLRDRLSLVIADYDAVEAVYRLRLGADHDWVRGLEGGRAWADRLGALVAELPG